MSISSILSPDFSCYIIYIVSIFIVTMACFNLKSLLLRRKQHLRHQSQQKVFLKVQYLFHVYYSVHPILLPFVIYFLKICFNYILSFKEPTMVKTATPESPKPTVVPLAQKVSPSLGRVSGFFCFFFLLLFLFLLLLSVAISFVFFETCVSYNI